MAKFPGNMQSLPGRMYVEHTPSSKENQETVTLHPPTIHLCEYVNQEPPT